MNAKTLLEQWAAQSRPRGRSGNLYYEGPLLYSYGPHYPLAMIKMIGTESVALINPEPWLINGKPSRATTGHQAGARCAASCAGRFKYQIPPHDYGNTHGTPWGHITSKTILMNQSLAQKLREDREREEKREARNAAARAKRAALKARPWRKLESMKGGRHD